MKEFADDNFKFDQKDRKFSKWVENTVGKGEIFPFSTVFSKGFKGASKGVIVWEWVKIWDCVVKLNYFSILTG